MASAVRRMIAVGVGVLVLAAAVVVTRAAPWEGPGRERAQRAGPPLRRCLGSRWRVVRPAAAGGQRPDTARNTFVILLMGGGRLPAVVDFGTDRPDRARPETAGTASLLPVIPLAFTGSTFAPVAIMARWLQAWANSNPITHAVDATRAPALGGHTSRPPLKAVAWIPGLLAVVLPLAGYRYRRVTQEPQQPARNRAGLPAAGPAPMRCPGVSRFVATKAGLRLPPQAAPAEGWPKNAAAAMNQLREAHHSTRPLHSPEGTMDALQTMATFRSGAEGRSSIGEPSHRPPPDLDQTSPDTDSDHKASSS